MSLKYGAAPEREVGAGSQLLLTGHYTQVPSATPMMSEMEIVPPIDPPFQNGCYSDGRRLSDVRS
jgi:hypothetical protein